MIRKIESFKNMLQVTIKINVIKGETHTFCVKL